MSIRTEPNELRDATIEDVAPYKPISPAAVSTLIFGFVAVIAAITAADSGWAFLIAPIVGILIGLRAFRSIRRYDMTGKAAARVGVVFSALALVGGSVGYAYYLETAVPPGYTEISYEPLQPKGGEQVPSAASELDGKKVFLRGYVYPTEQSRDIREFVLCRDNSTCCFGGQPKLTDMVEVKLKDPLRLSYTSSLRGVGGTLRIRPEAAPGELGTVLYHLEDVDVLH